jgi:hypothetical protein
MVMVRLSSPEIDRVGGVWAGMSGSPVYAGDGRLIGAVAYGLAGTSPVAGVTPFEDMDDYVAAPSSSPSQIAMDDETKRKIAAQPDVSSAQASGGFRRLPVYRSVTGVDQNRLDESAGDRTWLKSGVRSAGFVAGTSAPGAESVVAGGNLAVAVSWGDITFGGVGTATSVCGSKVVGFGHPMLFAGKTTEALMPATAIYIQEDPSAVPFKVANFAPPVGTITDDRLAGVTGLFGDRPATTLVTDYLAYGDRSRVGKSRVSVKGYAAAVSFYEQLANHDRVLDGIVPGTEFVKSTLLGHDGSGHSFTIKLRDRYTSPEDIAFESPWDVADQIAVIAAIRGVTIDRVYIASSVSDDTSTYAVAGVQQYRAGQWIDVDDEHPIIGTAGTRLAVRTILRSDTETKAVSTVVQVPANASGAAGEYVVGEDSGDFEDTLLNTLESAIAFYQKRVSHDQVSGSLNLESDDTSSQTSFATSPVGKVVVGGVTIPVRIRRS